METPRERNLDIFPFVSQCFTMGMEFTTGLHSQEKSPRMAQKMFTRANNFVKVTEMARVSSGKAVSIDLHERS